MDRAVESALHGVRMVREGRAPGAPAPVRCASASRPASPACRLYRRLATLRDRGVRCLNGARSCLEALTRVYGPGGVLRLPGRAVGRAGVVLRDEEGQGTTEYAILVGVLVVIAIVAIALFRGRIQELWDSIASAVNGL